MRIGVIMMVLLMQFSLTAQTTKGMKIKCKTDKEVYQIGENIQVKVKSWQKYRIPTNGDCSSSPIYPVLVKEVDGKYPFPENFGVVMACGLPYTTPIRKFKTTFTANEPGNYKILFYSDRGNIFSQTIIVK